MSSSNKRNDQGPNDRPSTAPQKNDKNENKNIISNINNNNNNIMKRLPSPVVKCKFKFKIY